MSVCVAPYVGAWIETNQESFMEKQDKVAPYVGAWIETKFLAVLLIIPMVAPYVGAWIETCRDARKSTWEESHPMWVRGLKPRYTGFKVKKNSRTLCGCVD